MLKLFLCKHLENLSIWTLKYRFGHGEMHCGIPSFPKSTQVTSDTNVIQKGGGRRAGPPYFMFEWRRKRREFLANQKRCCRKALRLDSGSPLV